MQEATPPWILWPDAAPGVDTNQGAAASYYDLQFEPFWARLGEAEKAAYLDRHQAPNQWRDWIALAFNGKGEGGEPFDVEADMRDSRAWAAARPAKSRPSLWARLRGSADD